MPKRRPALTDEEGELRELIREDFRGMRPVREAMPELIEAMAEFRRKLGRPKAEAPKVHIGFRLASDVVASIKASGRGYNARVEQALRDAGFGETIKREWPLKMTKAASAAKKRRSARQGTKAAVSKRRA
ncbi:MAG TPA: BrnA antitoxin family protein [Roseiarcus sp.]